MLISSSIPNLINGVSQQPPTLRLASQADEQVNFLSSVADGLTVRPPTRHLAKVDTAQWTDAFIHTINRDVTERYVVVIRNNTLRVFEAATGIERTVNAPNGFGYLSSAAKSSYRATTVADYTFILNRDVTTAVDSALSAARPNQAMVTIKGGNYGRTYQVFIDGVERASYKTQDGSLAAHSEDIDTSNIASELYNDLVAWGGAGYSFSLLGDLVVIERADTTAFTVRAEDGSGGVNISAIQAQVQRFSDLPKEAPNGFTVEVVGDQTSQFDNYFVRYETEGADGVGVWKETLKGGESYRLSAETLPHTLVREDDGTFTFDRPSWADRKVGDLEKVPHPSFAGRKIRDVYFYKNRLGFVSDENAVMSCDGEYFKFYRSTATTILDTDPIDVATTSNRVSLLNFAVPFSQSLLLFSDQSQFVLEGGDSLTASNAAITQATAFESLSTVRPVGVGPFVYFPVPRGGYCGLREYFVKDGSEQNDALDVTSHCPRYLPKGMFKMTASSAEDTLIALSSDAPNSLWVYRFFFNQEGKLQSSWSEWRMSTEDTILNVEFIESSVFLVTARSDGTFLEEIKLATGDTDPDSSITFRMDRGVRSEDCTVAFDAASNKTTITLPYETLEELHVAARGSDEVHPEGLKVPVFDRPAPNQLRLNGDFTGRKLMVGQKYLARYVFSVFYMRSSEAAGGVSANANGRLQLRYLSVDYTDTGYFRVVSTPRGRSSSEKIFSGRVLGISSGKTGAYNLATGRFRIPVMSRNTDANIAIECDSFLPASFTSAEWEATYTSLSRKV